MKYIKLAVPLLAVIILLAGCAIPNLSTEKITVCYKNGQEEMSAEITDSEDVENLIHSFPKTLIREAGTVDSLN